MHGCSIKCPGVPDEKNRQIIGPNVRPSKEQFNFFAIFVNCCNPYTHMGRKTLFSLFGVSAARQSGRSGSSGLCV